MANVHTAMLSPSPVAGASLVHQRVLFLEDSGSRTARVLPRYRRPRKPHHQRRTDNEKELAPADPLRRTNAGTTDDVGYVDANVPPETKPLLVVDVANVSGLSRDCPCTPGVVDRMAKLNGLPAGVAVTADEEARSSSKAWTRWRKLQSGLSLRRRVRERLVASQWWRNRRRQRLAGDVGESNKQNLLDSKSFPHNFNTTVLRYLAFAWFQMTIS